MMNDNPWERKALPTEFEPGMQQVNNTMEVNRAAPANFRRDKSDIDLKRLLYLWPWFLISIFLTLAGAKIWLRYQLPVFEAKMNVNMAEDQNSIPIGATSLFDTRNPMNDKADVLKAPTTLKYVVDSLHLNYKSRLKGRLKNLDLYKMLDWQIIHASNEEPINFKIVPQTDGVSFKWISGDLRGQGKFGQPFSIKNDTVLIKSNIKFDDGEEIECTYVDPWETAFKINDKLKIKVTDQSNSVNIAYQDNVPKRAVDILNTLVGAYVQATIETKSKSLVQSIDFMTQRITPLADELDSIESGIARFKSARGIVGLSAPGELYLTQAASLDREAQENDLKRKTISAVENFINNPKTKDENIALVGVAEPALQNLVAQYQNLRLEKDKMLQYVTTENADYQLIEKHLSQTRESIEVQLANLRRTVNLAQTNINGQFARAQGLLRSTPVDEKHLLERARQQNIKESLYLLLLQKREESQIDLARTTADIRVLSPARSQGPVKPKPLNTYAIAFGIGVLLPLLFGLGKEILNNKITSKEQLEQMVSVPLIGTVDNVDMDEEKFAIVTNQDRSVAAEQIRSIRASLRFYAKEGKPLVIIVTSSFSGEGKSFLSSNLAKSYALQNLKVALLELDMRKPKLAKRIGEAPRRGLSTVLIGENKLSEIILEDTDTPNLHLYPTGIIPANPSELLASPQMDDVMKDLMAKYDVIVIDTPPLGLVADAQVLAHYADASIVVVRFGVTPRTQVQEIENWNLSHKLRNMVLVLNGVRSAGYYGYNYSAYYYRNKYGYEYYSNKDAKEGKPSFFRSILNQLKGQ